MIDLQQFEMDRDEEQLLGELLRDAKPRRVAEFGSGLTTKFWAENCDAQIVTWDNYPEWIAKLKSVFADRPWLERVEFRLYTVTPPGDRTAEKDAVSWEGGKFDFLFLDGPRSAHPQNFGRSGSFRFAKQHAADGAMIVWHDANRPHEKEMARRYLGHCARRRRANMGWCRWEPPTGRMRQWLRRFDPRT